MVIGVWWLAWTLVPAWLRHHRHAGARSARADRARRVVVVAARRGGFSASHPGTRLYRSRDDRWIGGVLGGLGSYLGVEPLILRILVLVLTLLGQGVLVLAYIILWVLVPEQPLVTVSEPVSPPPPPGPVLRSLAGRPR